MWFVNTQFQKSVCHSIGNHKLLALARWGGRSYTEILARLWQFPFVLRLGWCWTRNRNHTDKFLQTDYILLDFGR